MIIESILKKSLFPILTESCYNAGNEVWKYNKFASLILFLIGFIFTPVGIILTTAIILLIVYRKEIF
jgi:hypothetical protein